MTTIKTAEFIAKMPNSDGIRKLKINGYVMYESGLK